MRCCRRVRSLRRRVSIGLAERCILLGQPCRGLRACKTGRQFAPACGTSLQWWDRTSQRNGSSTTSRGQPMSREGEKQEGRATCIVRAVFPTPPSPSTTSLYSVIFPAMVSVVEQSRPRQCRQRVKCGWGTDKGRGVMQAARHVVAVSSRVQQRDCS